MCIRDSVCRVRGPDDDYGAGPGGIHGERGSRGVGRAERGDGCVQFAQHNNHKQSFVYVDRLGGAGNVHRDGDGHVGRVDGVDDALSGGGTAGLQSFGVSREHYRERGRVRHVHDYGEPI